MASKGKFCVARRFGWAIAASVLALCPVMASAQAGSGSSGWRHTLTPYLMAATLEGTSAVGQNEVDLNLSASQIFSNLDFGAMLAYRGETDDWAIMTDLIYIKLGASKTSEREQLYARLNLDQTLVQVDAARRLSPNWEVTLGARYWDVENSILLTGLGPITSPTGGSAGDSWVDPVVGVRFATPIGEKWALIGKGDYGGFGVGADSTWQASLALSWKFSERLRSSLIYRYISVDYESGSGASRFALDVTQSGPGLGLSFSF